MDGKETKMKRSEQSDQICLALAKAQAQVKSALKGKENTYHSSKYADLADCWAAACEALAENDLFVMQDLYTEVSDRPVIIKNVEKSGSFKETQSMEKMICVTTIITHASGQWIESSPVKIPIPTNKAQEFGSCSTYARRYSLCATLAIVSADDDGNRATFIDADQVDLINVLVEFLTGEDKKEYNDKMKVLKISSSDRIPHIHYVDIKSWLFKKKEIFQERKREKVKSSCNAVSPPAGMGQPTKNPVNDFSSFQTNQIM